MRTGTWLTARHLRQPAAPRGMRVSSSHATRRDPELVAHSTRGFRHPRNKRRAGTKTPFGERGVDALGTKTTVDERGMGELGAKTLVDERGMGTLGPKTLVGEHRRRLQRPEMRLGERFAGAGCSPSCVSGRGNEDACSASRVFAPAASTDRVHRAEERATKAREFRARIGAPEGRTIFSPIGRNLRAPVRVPSGRARERRGVLRLCDPSQRRAEGAAGGGTCERSERIVPPAAPGSEERVARWSAGAKPRGALSPGRLRCRERRSLRLYQLRMMVWSRSGPTVTMLMGAPHSCSRRST